MTQVSETIETLKAMRVKLAAGWTRFAAARDADGEQVNSDSPKACSFCLLGAMWSLLGAMWSLGKIQRESAVEIALTETLKEQGIRCTLPMYNDAPGRTQEEILALVDKTIERLEKR